MHLSRDINTTRWVFGYGSLMWRPGFAFIEARRARLFGAHRSLCIFSHIHRGTPERPGLVLGLNRGGACRGVAFKVSDADWPDVVAYLRAREQVTKVYLETVRPLALDETRQKVAALCYVVDRSHRQFAGDLSHDTMVDMVRSGHGQSGPNRDYVINTANHLRDIGVTDKRLFAIAQSLQDDAKTAR